MTTQTSSPASPYTPPVEMLTAAEKMLAAATPSELTRAEALYVAYGSVTGQRSAVTGAELPWFNICPPLVRAGWLAASRALRGTGPNLGEFQVSVDTSQAEASMSRLEARADSLVDALGKAVSLLEKLDPPRVTVDTLNISPNDEELAGAPVDLPSAARTLAEARALVLNVEPNDPVRQLIDAAARALLESLAVKPAPADA